LGYLFDDDMAHDEKLRGQESNVSGFRSDFWDSLDFFRGLEWRSGYWKRTFQDMWTYVWMDYAILSITRYLSGC